MNIPIESIECQCGHRATWDALRKPFESWISGIHNQSIELSGHTVTEYEEADNLIHGNSELSSFINKLRCSKCRRTRFKINYPKAYFDRKQQRVEEAARLIELEKIKREEEDKQRQELLERKRAEREEEKAKQLLEAAEQHKAYLASPEYKERKEWLKKADEKILHEYRTREPFADCPACRGTGGLNVSYGSSETGCCGRCGGRGWIS